MARKIQIKELRDCPEKEWLGKWPERGDVDEIFHEDVDVYLPSGELAIVFRVGALKSTLPVDKGGTLTPENHKYWQWVSKALITDQRGYAAGRDIVTNPEIRLTIGQWEFMSRATRAKNPLTNLEEARQIIESDTRPSRNTYYIKKTEADGLVDLEEIERWDSICRKKNVDPALMKEATANRNAAKLAWFNNWFEKEWVPAAEEDRVAVAKAARKRYVTIQPRANRCYSNVLGAIDRSGRIPYGRLTASTVKRWDEFEANKPFYHEINDLLRETMPDKFQVLNDRFSRVKDQRYNLFGTAFTTITVNNNFQVAYHLDGNNAQGAVAVLCVMEKGTWGGYEFVFPQLGIGFDIREGDVFIGDNQGLIHGMLPIENESADAENVMFVYYQRDKIVDLDNLECENCRKDFLEHNVIHNQHKGTGEPKWAGSWAGMWVSNEWREFKEAKGMGRCSDTNYWNT
jgi:hypothetical protein